MLSDILIRLRALSRRKAVEGELEDEIRFHFERQVEKYVREGRRHLLHSRAASDARRSGCRFATQMN